MIELRQSNKDLGMAEYEMLQGIENGENGFMNEVYGMNYDEYKKWLIQQDDYHLGKNLPQGWIPSTTYFLYDNDIPIGIGRVRHETSEYLQTVVGAGEIGYGISKNYRGKGYGNILFKEILKKCKDFGYDKITLFPHKDNEATIKIMLKNGGNVIGKFKEEKVIIEIPTKESKMRLILNGGGSDEQIKEGLEIFAREVNGGKVLYVPLAWPYGNMEECINWFRGQVSQFGITNIEQILDPNDITREKLKETSGVFIGGGNTYQLLKGLKETHAFENLKEYIENGGLIMGGSAGALIFSECIDTCLKDELVIKSCNDENKVGLKDTKGFNCINGYSILPHYKKLPEQYPDIQKRVDKLLKQGYKLVCLPEETSLWINGNQMTIIGQKPAEIFDGKDKKVIHAEEEVLCR